MNRVLTPYARAVAMIELRLPPLEAETYQIHMPRLANALLRAPAEAGQRQGRNQREDHPNPRACHQTINPVRRQKFQ